MAKDYNAPVIWLGRLVCDITTKRTGLGVYLILRALFGSYSLSNDSIGAMAVVVDSINEKALDFYKRYGFEQQQDSKKMLFPMKITKQLI